METFFNEDDREETIIERRERERLENGKVDNDEHIPLIPDVKKDVRKTVHEIQVWKMDKPNDGYKGAVPPNSTMALIADLFGNGIYDFHAVTQDGKILRRNSRVSVSTPQKPSSDTSPQSAATARFDLLEWQARQHERDTTRVEEFGRMAIHTTRDQSAAQLRAISEIHASSQNRDREFFATLLAQQQSFFANMMQMQSQQHAMSMERQREDFTRTLQVSEQMQRANSPETVFQLLQAGMNLALGPGEDEEEETEAPAAQNPWVQALQTGADAIKEVASAAKMKASIAVPATPKPAESATPTKLPLRTKKKPPLTREELREVIRARRLMEQNGLDFVQTVRKATSMLTGGTPFDPSQPKSDDSDKAENGDSESGGETDVDNRESQ